MMTESQMEDHISSSDWSFVETKRRGTNNYNSHLGVLRVMFGITDDPVAITTLLSEQETEVWIKYKSDWERIFKC